MKPSTISSRWYFAFLAMLTALLSLCPQTLRADDCTLEKSGNYTVQIEGSNQLRFRFPVYSKSGADCWIVEGSIKIQIEGNATSENIFVVDAMEHNISGGDYNPWMRCHKEVDGTLTLFRERGYSNVNIGNTKEQYTTVPTKNNDDDDSYVNLLWRIPAKYRGQKVTISWSMHHNGNTVSEKNKWISINSTTLNISPAPLQQEPMLMEPIISYSVGSPNQIMVPYMIAANDIQSMTAYYTLVNGKSTTSRSMDLGTLSSGFINFDANQMVKDLYIKATYKNSEDDMVTSESDKMTVPILHHAYGLSAIVQADGKVQLEWMVPHTNWTDIMDNDMWEIQRNTTGNGDADDTGWANIGQIEYNPKQERFTFTDETLLQSYEQKPVYYRVRRTITSIWGWRMECGYAQTMLPATLALQKVTEFTAQRSRTWQETFHPVTLNFAIGGPTQDENGYMILRNAEDWKAFAQKVNEGQSSLNAIMAGDIDLGTEALAMVGTTDNPYRGTFNGNGHVLIFNPKDTINMEYAAPFRYVIGAHIANLHTLGHIVNNAKFTTGLIGQTLGNDDIIVESCHSSVIIDAGRRKGDATNGGFVAVNDCPKLTLRNCLFDGTFLGEQSTSNGGFIGWLNSRATVENGLFAPAYIGTLYDGCETFARNKGNLTLINALYSTEYVQSPYSSGYDPQGRFVIGSEEDWKDFAEEVKNAAGTKDVNAIMIADISVSQPAGTAACPYRGTFDGNGHSLNANIEAADDNVALFQNVKNSTFKNLHLTGTVKGGIHSAGLIGNADGSPTINIERVWVSANITTTSDHLGGIAGHTQDANMNVSDCRFDGTLSAPNATNSYAGAILGWGHNGTWAMHRVYEYGNYPGITNPAFSYWYDNNGTKTVKKWGQNERSTECNSAHDWSEMADGCSNAVNASAIVYWNNVDKSDTWVMQDGLAVPVMENTNIICVPAEKKTAYEQMTALGDKWQTMGAQVVPVAEISTNPAHQTMLWDSRAQLILTTEKYENNLENVFAIASADDWKVFAAKAAEANGGYEVNAMLMTDITISEPISKYAGIFEGNGHTITLNLEDQSCLYYALFRYGFKNITIRNLNVEGKVSGENYCAAIVGMLGNDMANLTIENCHVSANIETTRDGYAGGLVANAGSGKVTVRDCLFDGNMLFKGSNSYSMAAAFVNRSSRAQDMTVENCLENGSYDGYDNVVAIGYYDGNKHRAWDGATNVWTYATTGFEGINHVGSMSANQLAETLGSSWRTNKNGTISLNNRGAGVRYTERRVITNDEHQSGTLQLDLTTACLDHRFLLRLEQGDATIPNLDENGKYATKLDQGDLVIYKFENNVKITSVKADTLQSSVSLAWETNGVDADFFRIMRYDKMMPEQVDTLETVYTQTAYIDRNVRPQRSYVYTIQGITECEGEHISEFQQEGCCKPTGMVRGYVRLANGIGMPNVTVVAEPDDAERGNTGTCVTDSTGYFEIGDLRYQGYGKYTLIAYGVGDKQSVVFDESSNLATNIVFYEQTYYNFSGYVLYDGTSIPVSGVSFLRDGVPVIDASGQPVTTDNSGAFIVNIPSGPHTLQVVKDGHVFMNDGYHIDLDKPEGEQRKVEWKKDVSDIYLWDQTLVNLTGRVVGGNIEGTKPLGESLSKNNLGEDVTIVMTLEGDNTSWIVRDQKDGTITERHYNVFHGKDDKDTTRVDAYRHRIVVHPDPETGEYRIPLFPVKYKITEIYAKGYPTLFQSGMVSETIDLSSYKNDSVAVYSRIFHNSPTLDIWQFTGGNDRYYGISRYISRDNAGNADTLTVWRKDTGYTLGHPVFMASSSVPMLLSAREEYYYNNDRLDRLDIVQLDGGRVVADNQLVANNHTDHIQLDSLGQATYIFTPQNTTFMLPDDAALHTLKFTLEYDGSYYDIEPITAYIMAALPKPNGRHIIAGQNTHLVDILRDPPGSKSSAYIEKGSKMSYSYTADYRVQLGVKIDTKVGSGSNYFLGAWAGPIGGGTTAGSIVSSKNYATLSYNLATTYYNDWSYSYDFETKERISTSSHVKDVGMGSDVYIGMTDDVIVDDAIAVRLVNSATLSRLKPAVGGTTTVNGHEFNVAGTACVLARGYDPVIRDSIFLVRDEVMAFSSRISATFAHSQTYILDELIPSLLRTRNALLLDKSTTDSYARALAENTGKPVYVSLVASDDDHFATPTYYTRFIPTGTRDDQWNDTIQALNTQILTWVGFIAANEQEKLEAMDLVKIYDFDGRTDINYSEHFNTTEGLHRYWKIPSTVTLTGSDGLSYSTNNGSGTTTAENQHGDPIAVDFEAGGVKFGLNITPLFGFDFNYKNGKNESYTKAAGFTLSCNRHSNLSVAVYRTRELSSDSIAKLAKLGGLNMFYKHAEDNLKDIYNGRPGSSNTTSYIESLSSVSRYRNFVYRTLGGATSSPWEEERRTIFYNPGTILDQPTTQINKLRIWAENPSVSNVPYGEPARFTLYMVNESDTPERVKNEMAFALDNSSNPNGAKIYVEGVPLNGTPQGVYLEGNEVVTKQVEVYAAAEYDYENIRILLLDEDDLKHVTKASISAHFVPSAGRINISKPGDKWVVNTESAYDKDKKLYYLPVHIDGFDVNFRNFDHIELQYKLSTQGDKDWVNVCSYYPNTDEGRKYMALASGEKKLMESDGFIDANFYGEKDPVEQYYDIRAVSFCRHGSGYLTSPSNILTGIKDTRRPQPFGTPQPTNGILGIGDDIKIAFSEQIAYNYLSPVNNFEVLGLTNQSSLSLSTSLQFDGNGLASSMSERDLSAKDFTFDLMIKPERAGNDMYVLSHGMDSINLRLGVTPDWHLAAFVGREMVISDEVVDFSDIRHVAYVFDAFEEKLETRITFYNDDRPIGQYTLKGLYEGHQPLYIGSEFKGEMLEARLWNRAMTSGELKSYANKRLTGYELGLLDYYPMSEGRGEYVYDKAPGSNDLYLIGATWKVPDGISLKLDGTEGIRMNPQCFNREDYEDYTLMFWFRSNDGDATLISNGEAKEEAGAKDHFNIGIEDGKLFFRSGGSQITTSDMYNDGAWHHVAVTVNRARNVGNFFVDQTLKQTFAVDTLGGIGGNNLYLGATYDSSQSAQTKVLNGNIDEISMYEMSLPANVLKIIANQAPNGSELGLLAYLPFSQTEKQYDNSQRLMPTGISTKKYKDNHGEIVESHRDTIIAQNIIDLHYDRNSYAPMANSGKLENIKYSYVADGKDLYISLDVPDYQIEKTNVYITVKEVADLQGNLMASPVAMNLYVYRNPLRWNVKRKQVDMMYGEETTINLNIENMSGQSQDYTIKGLPLWITASQTSGKIGALDEDPITLTISPYINIGNFEEIIYIVGENGISEPLPLSIRVRGKAPEWDVDDNLKGGNMAMHIVARVMIDGGIAHDADDVLRAVGENHRTLGVAHLNQGGTENGLAYLTVYNTANGKPMEFEFYDASTGRIYVVEKQNMDYADMFFMPDTILFYADSIMGTASDPVVLYARRKEVQNVKLEKGWNWASTYLQPDEATVSDMMNSIGTWEVGEGLELMEADGRHYLITYKSVYDNTIHANRYYWDNGDKPFQLNPASMYRIFTKSPKNLYITGENVSYSGIRLHQGWNRIGYLSPLNLPLGNALSDYTDVASAGDIIKSQNEFAVLSIDAQGNRTWKGTLSFLRTGEGYMLKRQAATDYTFFYPSYGSGTIYNSVNHAQAPLFCNTTGSSMNVIARVEGVEVEDGDQLVAFCGAETRGVAVPDEEGLYFLSVASGKEDVGFAIVREGEIIATTPHQMPYVDNDVQGTLDNPTVISFVSVDTLGEGWYDLQGRPVSRTLSNRQMPPGVYIHNGQRVLIK